MRNEHRLQTVVFLDIDGVLALRPPKPVPIAVVGLPPRHRFGHSPMVPIVRKPKRVRQLSASCISVLNSIVAGSDSALVVSSSWRLTGDVRPILQAAGVEGPFHSDWRTDDDGPDRGAQISRWLSEHEGPPYIVLDDWPKGIEAHRSRTLLVNYHFGLQPEHVRLARGILMQEWVAAEG